MKLSKNLSLKEAIKSGQAIKHGIDNTPSEDMIEVLKLTAEKIFQPVRDHFGKPIGVTSMYRSVELNKKIGGSSSSQHCKGQAIDMDADVYDFEDLTNKDIFDYIAENLEFDQLIWEFGDKNEPDWVHVSYNYGHNRGIKLRAYKDANKKTQYARI